MKEIKLIALFVLGSLPAFSQIAFERVLPSAPAPQIIPSFEAVDQSATAYADVDGINGLDVLVTGSNNSDNPIAKLYLNDGNGNYKEQNGSPFIAVTEGAVAFADVDGNGSQDVFILGLDTNDQPVSTLYINDGNGNFTIDTNSSFTGVRGGGAGFADLDGQNGPDLIFTGLDGSSPSNLLTSKLYINDGSGVFTEKAVPFSQVNRGAVSFADVDDNNTIDVVLTGIGVPTAFPTQTPSVRTEIYLNDGNAAFTELNTTVFEGVVDSDAIFADVDGNNTQDLLISGYNSSNVAITKLYLNDGSAAFTESSQVFEGLRFSAIALADVEEDTNNDLDILISGEIGASNYATKLYTNDGSGNFTEVTSSSLTDVSRGDSELIDVNGDNSVDLIIAGQKTSPLSPVAEIYLNDGNGLFTVATGSPFEGVFKSASAIADFDGDGNEDVIVTGDDNDNVGISRLYSGDGSNAFSLVSGLPLAGVENSAIGVADVDGVNGPDVLISGLEPGFPQVYGAKLYLNDGSGGFTAPSNLIELQRGSIAFADVQEDGNNDVDVVITGSGPATSFLPETNLYTNDGNGNFTEVAGTPFEGVQNSSIVLADIDGQNGNDLIITGENSSGTGTANYYSNDGNGGFSLETTPFAAVRNSALAVGDVDGNGSLDVLICGLNDSNNPIATLYTNNGTVGNPTFTEVTGTPFEGVTNAAARIANIDGVNGNDIIISGENSSGSFITKLYINDGSGNFTEELNLPFEGVSEGDISLSDLDGDGLIDVLITGENNSGVKVSILYNNKTDFVPPTITSGSTASVNENETSSFYTATADESATFTLGTSKDESFFELSGNDLSFITAADFENPQDANTDNEYLVDLIATDDVGNQTVQEVAVTVLDVDESGPTITSPASVSVAENTSGTVYTATADVSASFSLGSSKDESLFTISSGEIAFNAAPDFENPNDADADNDYQLDLIATDGDGFSSTKAITITVTDVSEAGPVITSAAAVSVPENTSGTIYTATADVSATFSLGSSKDESFFSLSSGEIAFNNAPDFETPLDANTDNIYQLDLIATDGDGFSTTKAISITVTDVNEPGPVITSPASVSVAENTTEVVYTATADASATFSLGANKDEALFTFVSSEISFTNPPDFENPEDANADNIYELDLIATGNDGEITTKAITISVTDVDETPLSNKTPFTGKIYPNPVQNTLYIDYKEKHKSGMLYIFDGAGKLHQKLPFNKDTKMVDLRNLESGYYVMKLTTDGKEFQFNFIKE